MILLIPAAIIGSAIGFVALLPLGLLAGFVGLGLGGAIAILLTGLLIASARTPAASAKPFTAETDQARRGTKVPSRSQVS